MKESSICINISRQRSLTLSRLYLGIANLFIMIYLVDKASPAVFRVCRGKKWFIYISDGKCLDRYYTDLVHTSSDSISVFCFWCSFSILKKSRKHYYSKIVIRCLLLFTYIFVITFNLFPKIDTSILIL